MKSLSVLKITPSMTDPDVISAVYWLSWVNPVKEWAEVGVVIFLAIGVIFSFIAAPLTKRLDDARQSEIARLTAEAETAKSDIAKANAIAAAAVEKTEQLRQEEWQRRQPRRIADDKIDAFVAAIKGKIPAITVIAERDPEARAFAISIGIVLAKAEVVIHPLPPTPNNSLPKDFADSAFPLLAPVSGVLLYVPRVSGNIGSTRNDLLRKALTDANIFGGEINAPALFDGVNPNEYAIFVGVRPPWWQ
jgi:uncharacterized membrane protein